MAAAPYILARTFSDAHSFAQKDLGLEPGHYRVVNSAGTLKAVRGVDLYLVPGWQNRYDRFKMQSALRWSRMNVIDVAELAEAPALDPPTLSEVGADEATTFLLAIDPEIEAVVIPDDVATEPAEESDVKRRRRRCDECGQLHFKNEPCSQDA